MPAKIFSFGHIYLMQASCGLLKIGRSSNPELRRSALQIKVMENVRLLAVLEERGADEESIHIELKQYRLHGEWFSGTIRARKAIVQTLGIACPDWPFAWCPKTANELLNHLAWHSRRTSLLARRRKIINEIKAGQIFWWTNLHICAATKDHLRIVIHMSQEFGKVVDLLADTEERPPNYLQSLDAAALTGPPGWSGVSSGSTPAQVVIAGLEARSRWELSQLANESTE